MRNSIPVLPRAVALALMPLPLPAIRLWAQPVLDSMLRRHPSLLKRLGGYRDKAIVIDPTDLPFVFELRLGPGRPRIAVAPRRPRTDFDARILGPLAALLGLVHGAYDGDALFFSRDLVIEGDTEAVLALRNAIDDAEIDLVGEFAATLGPLSRLAERSARLVVPPLEKLTGVALTRARSLSA